MGRLKLGRFETRHVMCFSAKISNRSVIVLDVISTQSNDVGHPQADERDLCSHVRAYEACL